MARGQIHRWGVTEGDNASNKTIGRNVKNSDCAIENSNSSGVKEMILPVLTTMWGQNTIRKNFEKTMCRW